MKYRKHVSIENMAIIDLTIDNPFDQFPPAIETKLESSRSDTTESTRKLIEAKMKLIQPNIEGVESIEGIELEIENIESEYPTFGKKLQPKFIEFMKTFPQFPKCHPEGYGTVIELEDSILNHKSLLVLKGACQYTLLSEGHGFRQTRNIPFFTTPENEEGLMMYSHRRCAGVKVCEFLADELKVPHTEIDPDGHEWSKLLAQQQHAEANTFDAKVEKLREEYIDHRCSKYIPGSRHLCGGRTVIRSFEKKSKYTSYNRIFIGCEKWKREETDHTMIQIPHHDPITVMQTWGKERCMIHDDIIESLGIRSWLTVDSATDAGISINYFY
jgi:hypothetical protein